MPRKFYITTPIYYINYEPSVGSAYTTIIADVFARFHRMRGDDVFFLTGLDENSVKTTQAAHEKGFSEIGEYADIMAGKWLDAWKLLGISNDDFIRTSSERHAKNVLDVFGRVYQKGDIYKGKYKGLYCEGCEAFLTENDLENGNCPMHKKPPKQITEENYFFKLSKYQDDILEYIEEHQEFITPESRRHEAINFVKSGLKDISVSRPNLEWGIKLPIDEKQRFWVWFDALINYLSPPEKYWPADVHLIGKDIARFHCVIWPAMLMSAEMEIPKKVFAHGFFTVNGHKMSKSLGNAIDPVYLAGKYSVDALRYYLVRGIPFGDDGDFNEDELKERLNTELVSNIGNYIHRTLILMKKLSGSKVPEPKGLGGHEDEMLALLKEIKEKTEIHFEKMRIRDAQEDMLRLAHEFNKYMSDSEPWKEKDEKKVANTLYVCMRGVSALCIMMEPFIPKSSEKLREMLGINEKNFTWENFEKELVAPGTEITDIVPLFKKVE